MNRGNLTFSSNSLSPAWERVRVRGYLNLLVIPEVSIGNLLLFDLSFVACPRNLSFSPSLKQRPSQAHLIIPSKGLLSYPFKQQPDTPLVAFVYPYDKFRSLL